MNMLTTPQHLQNGLCLQQHLSRLHEMVHRPALQHGVTKRRVHLHDGIVLVPRLARFGVEPDEASATLPDFFQGPLLRIKGVVASVAEDDQNGVAREIAKQIPVKLIKGPAEIAVSEQIEIGSVP